jgi:hypothetical protein
MDPTTPSPKKSSAAGSPAEDSPVSHKPVESHETAKITLHHPHLIKKRTLIKDRIGCVRSSPYALREPDFIYGKPNITTEEGAGDIMSSWITSDPSAGKESSKLIVYSNVLAIKKGCVTARAIRQYARDHPNIRRKEALNHNNSPGSDIRAEGPFGMKSVCADENIKDIIEAKYTDYSAEDRDYPDTSHILVGGFMPKPRPTIASQSVSYSRELKEEKEHKPHFVMKRFQNVKSHFQKMREESLSPQKNSPMKDLLSPKR